MLVRKREVEREKDGVRKSEKELRMRACFVLARVRTPSSLVRERERERKKEGERDVEYVQNCHFYFLKE
jgi:hypothetical protein